MPILSQRTLDSRLLVALLTALACSTADPGADPGAERDDSLAPFGPGQSAGPEGATAGGSGSPAQSDPAGASTSAGDPASTPPASSAGAAGASGETAPAAALAPTPAMDGATGSPPGAPPDGSAATATHGGFYVDGRVLRDRCGEQVVLRGVNEMVIYTGSQDGAPAFAEIAKSGANSVRITWNTSGSAAKLDAAMQNALANQMIPMVVLNDATGDLSKLGLEVDYWVRSDVVAAIQKHADRALVNIGNEVGNGSVTPAAFTSAYQDAISRLRGAGIHTPLVIDGSSWGQDIDMLQAVGPGLLSFDPDHNLIFSVHMYWNDADGTRLTREINESVAMNLPLIVGEFAQHAVSGCSASPFAYQALLALAKTADIGFLPWSWGAVKNGDCQDDQPFDMTSNGRYDGLQGWGEEVAVSDPNSIQNTSVRSRYITTGSCD